MTPPIIWYTDHDGIAVPTDSPQPGAVPYMLARPLPIETAPRDGTRILAWVGGKNTPAILMFRAEGWVGAFWDGPYFPEKWLPLPPAPEEA